MSLNIKEYTTELWAKVKSFISSNYQPKGSYASSDHNHNSVYLGISAKAESAKSADSVAWDNVSGKPSSYTPSSHTHDDRYYTESEIDTKLGGKSNTDHTHSNYLTGITKAMVTTALGYTPPTSDTNTHYTTTLYAGAKDAKSNAATTNGNAYIKLYDDSTVRSQLNIKGSGATSVTTDANGVITISSTDNNTTYSFSNKAATLAWNTAVTVATVGGVDITVKLPANPNTNTWNALKGSTTSAAGTAGYAPAPAAGAANRYLRCDGTWQVPPDNNTTYSNATQSASGLMSVDDKKKLDGIAAGANKYSLPASPSVTSLTVTNSSSAGVVFGTYRVYVG